MTQISAYKQMQIVRIEYLVMIMPSYSLDVT
jgi:hypothetical protein